MVRCASDFVEDRSAELTNDFLNDFSKLGERWHNLLTVFNQYRGPDVWLDRFSDEAPASGLLDDTMDGLES